MPRRDFEDDDRPRRPHWSDDDDRPQPRSRSRYDADDDDDYYGEPTRGRRKPAKSNSVPIVVGILAGGFALVVVAAVVIYLFRSARRDVQPPVQVVNANPPMAMNPMGPMGPGGVMQPGGPALAPIVPKAPVAAGTEIVNSNLRLQGIGARRSLVFDYRFSRGKPFPGGAQYVAVVTEPGQRPDSVVFPFIDEQGTLSIDTIGAFGGAVYPSGTTVYMGKRALGGLGTPAPISNTLTLP